jgi:hypothetical protein
MPHSFLDLQIHHKKELQLSIVELGERKKLSKQIATRRCAPERERQLQKAELYK